MEDLWAALALFLVLEGLLPFAFPERWRQWVRSLSELDNHQLRWMGAAVVTSGMLLLWMVRG
ncbi:DUF2065 domain-containing protein [Pleionea sp. CnH1-48]|uniref:DUF2065 domain-containing protein n=1 Tax=Pleionea sp. CnH1-48 TaxID=2954494 RepID=UPI00209820C0|nr:DUF2065 domain-containing protein [Pleionea sp. CnH1-48]MCO7224860.1 DUF2065 domain-containing protein [Pleionea sp. CnH1-48]